jgi:hypothetical protein
LDFEGEEQALRELTTESKNERFEEGVAGESISQSQLLTAFKAMPSQSPSESQASSDIHTPSSTDPQQETQQPVPATKTTTKSPLSTRTVSLPVINRRAFELWYWFQKRTKCIDVPESAADKQVAEELAQHAVKADEDRIRVKTGLDAVRAKELMLKRARGDLERMRAEDLAV